MIRLLKMLLMWFWNVAGKFLSPKNMTVASNNPLLVTKAAFHSPPSLMHMLLYPCHKSSLVKIFALLSRSTSSGISGSG